MTKLIRFDEDHFGYLIERRNNLTDKEIQLLQKMFELAWPGKTLIVIQADEFIDLTGQFEIVKADYASAECPFCKNTIDVAEVIQAERERQAVA